MADRVRFVTDERLDVPDAHAMGDLPDAALQRLMKEFFGTYGISTTAQRPAVIRNFSLAIAGANSITITRVAGDTLLFDKDGKLIASPFSSGAKTISVTAAPDVYFVNVGYLEAAGDTVAGGEGATATRKRWNRTTDQENSILTSPRRLDSWQVQTTAGVIDAAILDSNVDAGTATAGWITIGTVTVAGGVVTTVTPRNLDLARARDWRTNPVGQTQAALRSLKELYDALATMTWELKARRGTDDLPNGVGGIDGWFRTQLAGLTRRGIIFPDFTGGGETSFSGPEFRIDSNLGAGQRSRIRAFPPAVAGADGVFVIPTRGLVGSTATASVAWGNNADQERARANLEQLNLRNEILSGTPQRSTITGQELATDGTGTGVIDVLQNASTPGWVIADHDGHLTPRVNAYFQEDFIAPDLGPASNVWRSSVGGVGAVAIAADTPAMGTVLLTSGGGGGDFAVVETFPTILPDPSNVSTRMRMLFLVRVAGVANVICRFGLTDNAVANANWVAAVTDPADGLWKLLRLAGGVGAPVSTGVAVVAGYTWLDLRILNNAKAVLLVGLGTGVAGVASSAGAMFVAGGTRVGMRCGRHAGAGGTANVDRVVVLGQPV